MPNNPTSTNSVNTSETLFSQASLNVVPLTPPINAMSGGNDSSPSTENNNNPASNSPNLSESEGSDKDMEADELGLLGYNCPVPHIHAMEFMRYTFKLSKHTMYISYTLRNHSCLPNKQSGLTCFM